MSRVTLRCAVYTRKSSEEGLEQGFNSLDAQQEACEAYIASQQHEGWKLVPTLYDDGGYSGGNIERPGLQKLLADIDQKKVQVVVVYKVDRLTRSLADFAKIVEQFDGKGVSFVSVTQQFNTTSSMGRLTLNVLLSFAQFEREVTGERIRDKIAASKQKGLWMGGTPPIGYAGQERTLVIDEPNAERIRGIYRRYLELKGIRPLKLELDRTGVVAPQRVRLSGQSYGGKPFSRGNLHHILTNPVYIGKVTHFDRVYDGQHPAIIDPDLWEAVQAKIARSRQSREQRPRVGSDSLLAGMLYDREGQRLCPSHSQKQSRRFRYYLSQKLVNESKATAPQGIRIPAQELEDLVIGQLCGWLRNADALLQECSPEPEQIQNLMIHSRMLAEELQDNQEQRFHLIRRIVEKVVVSPDQVEIVVRSSGLNLSRSSGMNPCIHLKMDATLKRCGYSMRLVLPDGEGKQKLKDPHLIQHLSKAVQWLDLLISGKAGSMKEIAETEGVDSSHVARVINRAFLAPDISRAILHGKQPSHFNLKFLKQFRTLPTDWDEQRKLLGFAR